MSDNDFRGVYPDLDEADADRRGAWDFDMGDPGHPGREPDSHNAAGFDADGVHLNGTRHDDRGFDSEGVHRDTGFFYDPEGFDVLGLDADDFTRDGLNIVTMRMRPKSSPVVQSQPVVATSDGPVVRFGFKSGAPHTVQALDPDTLTWGRVTVVASPSGKALLVKAKETPAEERKIPQDTARAYAKASRGSCLLCGRSLSDPVSQARGYGSDCATKVRPAERGGAAERIPHPVQIDLIKQAVDEVVRQVRALTRDQLERIGEWGAKRDNNALEAAVISSQDRRARKSAFQAAEAAGRLSVWDLCNSAHDAAHAAGKSAIRQTAAEISAKVPASCEEYDTRFFEALAATQYAARVAGSAAARAVLAAMVADLADDRPGLKDHINTLIGPWQAITEPASATD